MNMHEILAIIKTSELGESVRRETDATGIPFNIHVDPSASEFKGAINRSGGTRGESDIRGLIDNDGHFYIWDGYHAHHNEVVAMLGLSNNVVRVTFSEIKPGWLQMNIWRGTGSVSDAVTLYPRLKTALKFFKVDV